MPSPLKVPLDPGLPMCSSGKRPIATREEAEQRLAEARRMRRDDPTGRRHGGTEQRVVFCLSCNHWHMTSAGPNRRQGRAAKERKRLDRRS